MSKILVCLKDLLTNIDVFLKKIEFYWRFCSHVVQWVRVFMHSINSY